MVDMTQIIVAHKASLVDMSGYLLKHARPIADPASPLLRIRNMVALPHMGSVTQETCHAMAHWVAANRFATLADALDCNNANAEVLSL
jgi:glyoxylate/hydroxypyruvate/2-ketogluconate reductase